MAIFRKGDEIKIKNSPFEKESLKKQGFEEVDDVEPKLLPLTENPEVKEETIPEGSPEPEAAAEIKDKPKKGSKKS